jgi:PAS domain S-box-containing protein
MTKHLGLKQKITIAVSVLVVFLVASVGFITFAFFEKQLKAAIAQSQSVLVAGLASQIDKTLVSANNQLIAAALRIPPAALKDSDQAQAFLDSMIGLQRVFDNQISILTPEGKILAETPFVSGRRGFDISFRPYYKDTAARLAPVISDPYISSLAQKHPIIMMTAPIIDKKGALVGILSGAVDLMGKNVLQDISRIAIGRSGYLFLTTGDSRLIIMHPDAKRILTPIPLGANLLYDQAVDGFEGTGETVNTYGVRMLDSFKHLKINNWILTASYPISEAHEMVSQLEKQFFMASVIGIICVLLIVFFLIKYLTSPLTRFTRHIDTLAGKEGTDKLVDIRTHDEIGALSQAFNRMIGELDRQEEVILKSEERYRTVFDSANDAIFVQNLSTVAIVDVNRKMCEMFGFSREEALLIDIGALSSGEPPYTAQELQKWIAKAAQGMPQLFEWQAKDKNQRQFWVEIKMRLVEIGGADHLLVTVSDITKRKLAAEALQESEKRMSQIINFLPDATFAIDLDGNVIAWNKAIEEMTGVKTEEMIGKGNYEYSIPFYGIRRPILIDLVFTQDEEVANNYFFVRKEGDCLFAEIDATINGTVHNLWGISRPLFDCNGTLVGAIESIRDITNHKRSEAEKALLEDKLLQAQKMESLGTLAGGIAHDFNNILTALIGYGNLLQMKMDKDDPLRVYVDQMLKSSEIAANLTQNLLAFTRKQVAELKHHDLNALIQGMKKLLQRLLSEDIELKTVLTDQDVTIMTDITQIDQVLLNLAANARDAMPNGGKLMIETERVTFDQSFIKAHGFGKPGEFVLVSVSDTGIGMDKKTKEKIFEPFFTTKEVGKGTGLGLSTVYGIVNQHNGIITVYSEPNEGTTFHIYLPHSSQKPSEDMILPSIPVKGGTETILIAEDHDDSRCLIKEVLESNGYTVIETVDGADAVQKYTDFKDEISLLILDVVMPRKNGMHTFEEIKKIKPDINVLFMSGYTGDIVLDKGILKKEFNFISKPLSPNTLLRKIRGILDTQKI